MNIASIPANIIVLIESETELATFCDEINDAVFGRSFRFHGQHASHMAT